MPAYQAFGLVVATNHRIPGLDGAELPDLSSTPDLVVRLGDDAADEPRDAADWHQSVPDDAGDVLRVTRSLDGAYRFAYTDGCEFVIDADGREIRASWPSTLTLDDAAVYLLGPVIAFVLRMRGVVCLHASATAVGDGCFAIVVPGGHGKSTTAAACARLGMKVLTDDVLALQRVDDEFLVVPAYPMVRLWSEAVAGLFGSADALPRLSPEHASWDKRYLDLANGADAFQKSPLPLRAVYTHGREESDPPAFERLAPADALVMLVSNVYSLTRPEPDQRAREFGLLEQLAHEVPVKRYRGRYGLEHLDEQCELLRADCMATAGARAAG